MQAIQISQLLRSLVPTTQEELSLLRRLLACAQLMQRKEGHADLGLGPTTAQAEDGVPPPSLDVAGFLRSIPEDAKRYLHGLVEAMEIYQSIYGRALPVHSITLSDKSVSELKQIRDMCLEEGLHSIY